MEKKEEDSDGEELGEAIFLSCGRSTGARGGGGGGSWTPTTIDGITLDAGPGRMEEQDRLIEGHGSKKEEESAARYKAESEEAAARHAESLRWLEEDLDQHKAEKAALEKKAADNAMEGKEGKEGKE